MYDLLTFFDLILVRTFNLISKLVHRISQRIKPPKQEEDKLTLGKGNDPFYPKRSSLITITREQRDKHIYIIGGTGTGKTKFLEGLIRQDITEEEGFGVIDCHGDLIRDTLRFISTLEESDSIIKRVILLDPTWQDYSLGFNPLQLTSNARPYAQALELIEVFKKIWEYWGPRMDELARNTLVTLTEAKLTLLEVQPLLANDSFRAYITENLSNAEAKKYWYERYDSLSKKMKSQYAEPLLNKTQAFLGDPAIKNIVGQKESSLSFRQIMDSGKILLVNLSKGFLKENSYLLGALLLAKIQMAALSRTNIPENRRRRWYLYVDEFQNFATESFAEILSEARKYGLSLVMAHQSLSQLNKKLRSSIFSNVLTHIFFGVSREDAKILASEISYDRRKDIITKLIEQETRQAFVKIRGEIPRQMKTPYIPNPNFSEEEVYMIERKILSSCSRKSIDIKKEIEKRKEWITRISEGDIIDGEKPKERKDPKFAPEKDFEEGF